MANKKTKSRSEGTPWLTSTPLDAKGRRRLKRFRDLGVRWWSQEDGGPGNVTDFDTSRCRTRCNIDTSNPNWRTESPYVQKDAYVQAVGWLLGHPTGDQEELAGWEEVTKGAIVVLRKNMPNCRQYRMAISEARRLVGDKVTVSLTLCGDFTIPDDFDPESDNYEIHLVRKGKKSVICVDPEVEEIEYD